MEYKMIIRQTLFGFSQRKNGKLKLRSVRFLRTSVMQKKGEHLLVSNGGRLECFISGKTPIARLSREQFRFVIKAARFFGCLPDQKNLPVWLWDGDDCIPGGMPVSGRKVRPAAAVVGY